MVQTKRADFVLLFLIAIVAICFRLWRIDTLPPGFHFDESFEGLEAWRIASEPDYRPIFLTGNYGVAPLNSYANAITFSVARWLDLPIGPTAMRVTAAIFGVLGVLAVAAAAGELRRLDGQRALSAAFPLFAAAVLAVLRWHIHFSRIGIEPVIVPLLWAAFTWLFLRGWRTGGWLSFAASGVILATSMYTYQGSWVIPLIAVFYAGLLVGDWRFASQASATASINDPASPLRQRLLGILLAAGVAAVLVAPLAWFFWNHPDLLLLRPSQINVMGEQAVGEQSSIGRNLFATSAMFWPFGATGDLDPRRNLPGAPALDLWLALPFLAGLVLALLRIYRPAYPLILVSLIGLLSVGVMSEYAPHFHRVLGASAPVAVLCAIGLDALWQWRPAHMAIGRWLTVLLVVAATLTSARDYFVRWAALPDLYYAFDVGLWEVGSWLAAQPAGTPIYLTPRTAEHPTLAFPWSTQAQSTEPQGHTAPVTFDGRAIFPLTDGSNPLTEQYVSIEAEDFRTRLLLPDIFPSAQVTTSFSDFSGQNYANVYERAPSTLPQRPPLVLRQAEMGDGIRLLGYDVQPAQIKAGEVLYLQLHWLVGQAPGRDWTVFSHLIEIQQGVATVRAGKDGPPGNGSLPTSRWQPGWRILDEYQIQLPADLAPGEYHLDIGMYDAAGAVLPTSGEAIRLGEVTIE
jgi:hypothetical protein